MTHETIDTNALNSLPEQLQNYMVVELSYNAKIILPYKEGVKLLKLLTKAEYYIENYGKPTLIQPIKKLDIPVYLVNGIFYNEAKVAYLLNPQEDPND